jgi:hypothetical protein
VPLGLAAAALLLDRRRALRPAVLCSAMILVAWGDFAPLSPWSLLHRLPMGEAGAGTAAIAAFSFDRIDVDVRAPRGATLVVNQNFDRRWRSDLDVRDFEGVLAVPLPPGKRRARLEYRPASLRWGAAISAAAALGLVLWLRRGRSSG